MIVCVSGQEAHRGRTTLSKIPAALRKSGCSSKGANAGANSNDKLPRHILPIPDAKHVGLTTPRIPIRNILPLCRCARHWHPERIDVLLDDVGFGASGAFGGPLHPDLRTPRGQQFEVQSVPYDRFVLAVASSASHRAKPSLGPYGRDHRDGDVGSLATTASGRRRKAPLPEILKLKWVFDGAVRQVP